ncbi:hypothetical protein PhCBS80983_g05721 [Powellomyces hirtus]|uniref:Uncharacterized protein n=1 Tax=Powellomyces hirtus TaxID=109895 RepID=A0A507DSU1_9FUNG|nr:hypothetical protein PhCBS80983_g05721 [Powellomyces hirtus]
MARYEPLPFETEAPLDPQADTELLLDSRSEEETEDPAVNDEDKDENDGSQTHGSPPISATAAAAVAGTNSTTTTAPVSSTTTSTSWPYAPRDGVFSNLHPAAKTMQDSDIEPPSYFDTTQPPAYVETTVVTNGIGEDGEVLIEGLPVGDFFTFFVNLFVSMSFDFIGYLLTAVLASSHAARAGARMGLGITLIRYGAYISHADDNDAFDNYEPNKPTDDATRDDDDSSSWVSALLAFLGTVIVFRSLIDYLYIKKLEAVVKASSASEPTPAQQV